MKIIGFVQGNIINKRYYDAASKKTYKTYDLLSKKHDVTLISIVPIKSKAGLVQINKKFKIVNIKLFYPTLFYYMDKFKLAPSLITYKLHGFFLNFFKKHIYKNYDLYIFDNFLLSSLIDLIPSDKLIVYAAHNVEYDWYKDKLSRFIFSQFYFKYIYMIEKKLCSNSSLIMALSDQDKKRFIELYSISDKKIFILPIGYDEKNFDYSKLLSKEKLRKKYNIPKDKKVVIFCGSNFYTNQLAVDNIINNIAPFLNEDIILLIVGTVCDYILKKYPRISKNVILLGFISNIMEIYKISNLALNPVGFGSGVNVKTIECLSAGLDLITTSFGMRGYEKLKPYVILSSIDVMANKINEYFIKDKKIFDMSQLKRYQWPTIIYEYNNLLEAISKPI